MQGNRKGAENKQGHYGTLLNEFWRRENSVKDDIHTIYIR